ncbi:MAG TPA: hypothetical protein VFJ82_17260, partial [Longimicrobium sp.]|nr:hypothetical protein [Longimicrobium sp.]
AAFRMNVHYWPVGIRSAQPLPLSHDQIAGMLLQDWAPLNAPPPASALFGWPAHLIQAQSDRGTFYWEMREELASTERQWKRVIAWMLGVVGARHLLAEEGYRWIAPVSAFFANAQHPARVYNWHRAFPPGAVVTQGFSRQRANGTSRPRATPLLPDYLAIRPRQVTGVRGWAAVEAKGTDDALHTPGKDNCPRSWRRQAWNLIVTLHGARVPIPRHIVAATRVNPGAKKWTTRCLHVRGWNSADRQPPEPPPQLAVEIAAAHLFGLCLSLGLVENAAALAAGVKARGGTVSQSAERRPRRDETLAAMAASADEELSSYSAPATGEDPETRRIHRTLVSPLGLAEVTIEPATTMLIERLRSTDIDVASAALDQADTRLNDLMATAGADAPDGTLLQDGLRIRFKL